MASSTPSILISVLISKLLLNTSFLAKCNIFYFCLFPSPMCRQATLSPSGSEETRKPGWFVRPQGLASGTSMYSLRASFSSSAHTQSLLLLMEVMHIHWKMRYFVVSPLKNTINARQNYPTRLENLCPVHVLQRSNLGSNLWNENYDVFLNWNMLDIH